MDISLVARKGSLHLIAYKGIAGKRHYTVKWCKKDRLNTSISDSLQDSVYSSGVEANSAAAEGKYFAVFQKKRVNRLKARKFSNPSLFKQLKNSYFEGNRDAFLLEIKNCLKKGLWGIELEEFLKRETGGKRIFQTETDAFVFCRSCWLDAISHWLVTGELTPVQCLEQLFNLEERLRIDGLRSSYEPLIHLKRALQEQLNKGEKIDQSLVALYVDYELYTAAQSVATKATGEPTVVYIETLISKATNNAELSVMQANELCLLLEKVVECAGTYKNVFPVFSSGYHKWQQLTICINPLLDTLKERLGGNMFKSNTHINELIALGSRLKTIGDQLEERGSKKKVRAVSKLLEKLYKVHINKKAVSLLS